MLPSNQINQIPYQSTTQNNQAISVQNQATQQQDPTLQMGSTGQDFIAPSALSHSTARLGLGIANFSRSGQKRFASGMPTTQAMTWGNPTLQQPDQPNNTSTNIVSDKQK